jgi:hypothetical protein
VRASASRSPGTLDLRGSTGLARTVGRHGREVVAYYRRRGGQVPSRLRHAGHALTGSMAELHTAVNALDTDTVPEAYYRKFLTSRE